MSVTTNIAQVQGQMTRFIDTVVNKAPTAMAAAAAEEFYERAKIFVPVRDGKLRNAIFRKLLEKDSREGFTRYVVSWNHKKASHGHWFEFGWKDRYVIGRFKSGKFRVLPQKGKRGVKPPKRNSRRGAAFNDARFAEFYQLRPGGPIQRPGKPFIKPAYYSGREVAAELAKLALRDVLARTTK